MYLRIVGPFFPSFSSLSTEVFSELEKDVIVTAFLSLSAVTIVENVDVLAHFEALIKARALPWSSNVKHSYQKQYN